MKGEEVVDIQDANTVFISLRSSVVTSTAGAERSSTNLRMERMMGGYLSLLGSHHCMHERSRNRSDIFVRNV